MRKRLLSLLLCPACGTDGLEVVATGLEGEEILEGAIQCRGCGKEYPIVNGIPRMLPEAFDYFPRDRARADSSGSEAANDADAKDLRLTVQNYSAYQGKAYAPLADRLDNRRILELRTSLDLADFEGKVCLDAGCGVGRLSRTMAKAPAELVVGFDAGYAVDAAKEKSKEFENIEWVQADILRPPFKLGSFDRVISIGVLNLTARPDVGFVKLANLVKKGGTLSLYVHLFGYVPWNKLNSVKSALGHLYDTLTKEPFRKLVSRMPDGARYGVCKALWEYRSRIESGKRKGGLVGKIAQVIERLGPASGYKPMESAESNIVRNFDSYSTPFQHSNEFTELLDWFEGYKTFRKLKVAPYRLSVTGWIGEERAGTEPLEVWYSPSKPMDEFEAAGVETGEKSDAAPGEGSPS